MKQIKSYVISQIRYKVQLNLFSEKGINNEKKPKTCQRHAILVNKFFNPIQDTMGRTFFRFFFSIVTDLITDLMELETSNM